MRGFFFDLSGAPRRVEGRTAWRRTMLACERCQPAPHRASAAEGLAWRRSANVHIKAAGSPLVNDNKPVSDASRLSAGLEVMELDEVPRGFLGDEVEGEVFYRATRGAFPGFTIGVLAVRDASGATRALAPYFLTRFQINTMLEAGLLKQLTGWISLRIACVGHPAASFGRVAGELNEAVIAALHEHLSRRAPIVCFKGFGPDLPAERYVRVRGLPVAAIDFDAAKWAEVRASRNIRRKIKEGSAWRLEESVGLPRQHLDRIYDLYCQTHARATTTLGRLTAEFFVESSEISVYSLVFDGDVLIGFSQIMRSGDRAVASFMGMDYSVADRTGLYFVIVIRILDLAPQLGLRRIELGETSYTFKQRVGCVLEPTWIYYRHRNALGNALLSRLAWLIEPTEDELK